MMIFLPKISHDIYISFLLLVNVQLGNQDS